MTPLILIIGLNCALLGTAHFTTPNYYESNDNNVPVRDQSTSKLQSSQRRDLLQDNVVTPCPLRRLLTWKVKAPEGDQWAFNNNRPSDNTGSKKTVQEDVRNDRNNVKPIKVPESNFESNVKDSQMLIDCSKMQTRRSDSDDNNEGSHSDENNENKDILFNEEILHKFLTLYNSNDLSNTRRSMSDGNFNMRDIATYDPNNSNEDSVARRVNYRGNRLSNINVKSPRQMQLQTEKVIRSRLDTETQNKQPIQYIPSAQEDVIKMVDVGKMQSKEKQNEKLNQKLILTDNGIAETENRLSTKEIEEKLMEPTKGVNIFPLKATDMMKMESSRVCYACSSVSDISCLYPDRRTTVKYCKRGHSVCVTKVYESNDQDQIVIRDCSDSCDKDVPVLNTRFKTCSVCKSDLCNNKLVENGATANTQSIMFIAFFVYGIKYCML